MAIYGVAYIIALLIFAAMDGTWLTVMGSRLYKPTLEPLLLPTVKIGPAVGFYLLYTVGLVVFAITPALKAGSVIPALVFGALLGAVAYGTYDLTNFATLKVWSWQITIIDICWGAFASAVIAALTTLATRALAPRFGLTL